MPMKALYCTPHWRLGSSPRHHNQLQGPISHTLIGYWGQLPWG